jgi:hypothetical protein
MPGGGEAASAEGTNTFTDLSVSVLRQSAGDPGNAPERDLTGALSADDNPARGKARAYHS